MHNYRDLKVWNEAMCLVVEVYRLSGQFPREEMFGLTSQMRRAAISVPANIAEGQGRFTRREEQRYLRVAMGSLRELETELLIAGDLSYLSIEQMVSILERTAAVGRMLNGLVVILGVSLKRVIRASSEH